jgi:tripartite-type tricarboxylate transporter receptor subunit TctC
VTDEWKQQLEHNNLESRFMRSREFAAWLEAEYAATKSVMADLGLLK